MSKDEKHRPLSAIVGQRLREFRAAKGLRQADVAAAAKEWGLPWARSSIAAIEGGNRNLSLEETLLLPYVLSRLGGWDKPILPAGEWVALTPTRLIETEQLGALAGLLTKPVEPMGDDPLEGVAHGVRTADQKTDQSSDLYPWQAYAEEQAWKLFCAQVYPGVDYERDLAYGKKLGADEELIGRIARRLVNPKGGLASWGLVALLSWVLWRAPFEAERDRRTDERSPGTDRARQSVKGHVTREMIAEMEEEASSIWPALNQIFGALSEIWDDAEKLKEWAQWARIKANRIRAAQRRHEELQAFYTDYPRASELLAEIGESLRVSRNLSGLSLKDVAEVTGLRLARFVEQIEAGEPVMGKRRDQVAEYIRHYAQAVGLDGEAMASRFQQAWAEDVARGPYSD